MHTYDGRESRIASIVLLALFAAACNGSPKEPAQSDAGTDAGSKASGGKGGAGAGGKGGSSGGTSTGTAGDAGTALPAMMITCTEPIPTTPVLCGGEVCQAPTAFATNPCIISCCLMQAGKEVCASKSAAMGFSTECAMPAVADPRCPDVDAMATPLAVSMGIGGGVFKGCCNAGQHKCGIISSLRPGCLTESTLVTLPPDPQACSEPSDDGGTGLDGG
jgi:hypothetical protein